MLISKHRGLLTSFSTTVLWTWRRVASNTLWWSSTWRPSASHAASWSSISHVGSWLCWSSCWPASTSATTSSWPLLLMSSPVTCGQACCRTTPGCRRRSSVSLWQWVSSGCSATSTWLCMCFLLLWWCMLLLDQLTRAPASSGLTRCCQASVLWVWSHPSTMTSASICCSCRRTWAS